MGKASCEDLCYSGSSFTCAKGPVPNPHDMTRCAGGSSSGCAVLVSGNINFSQKCVMEETYKTVPVNKGFFLCILQLL